MGQVLSEKESEQLLEALLHMREEMHSLTIQLTVQTESLKNLARSMELEQRYMTNQIVNQGEQIVALKQELVSFQKDYLTFKTDMYSSIAAYKNAVKILWLLFGGTIVTAVATLLTLPR